MEERYRSVREAAALLGVTERTIYRKLWSGEFPGAISVGRAIRIPEAALDSLPQYTPPVRQTT